MLILEEYLFEDLTSETRRLPAHPAPMPEPSRTPCSEAVDPSCTKTHMPRISPSWPFSMEPTTDINGDSHRAPKASCEEGAASAAFVRGFLGAGRWVRTTAGIMELIEIYFRGSHAWLAGGWVVLSWTQHWSDLVRLIVITKRLRSIVSQQVCAFISSRDRDRDRDRDSRD
jgi:hypothetical protein